MTQTKLTAMVVLSSLFVFGMPAIMFAPDAEAAKKLPGASKADARLQRDVMGHIAFMESLFGGGCKKAQVVDTAVAELPAKQGVDSWVEHWTVDRCGTQVRYRVQLTPSPKGGTDFAVRILEDEKQSEQSTPADPEALPREALQETPPQETPPK